MLSQKQTQTPVIPWAEEEQESDKYFKTKETTPFRFISFQLKSAVFFLLSLSVWLLLLFLWLPPPPTPTAAATAKHRLHKPQEANLKTTQNVTVPPKPFSVYVYNLPPEFNLGLLNDCSHLNIYTNMCPYVANRGLGQPVPAPEISGSEAGSGSWFATHQFLAEMIFHARMENHPSRTWDTARADLFYVPFYGGLYASSKFREANLTARDELAVRFVDFLESQSTWQRNHGKDHFIALGRTAWDFMRTGSVPDFGANSLIVMPRVKNMSVLTVERNPWKGTNQYGIPYPSYFHPYTSDEMLMRQKKVREYKRRNLFSFIGGPRKGLEKAAIRDELIRQCGESTQCELLKCGSGSARCYDPREVIGVMTRSEFCLQAPGDSFTRRSTFDSVLAGCIPVFFSPHTAYTQYAWFLPEDPNEYSVFIDEKGNASRRIEQELLKIPRKRVEKMRETVIGLIPKLTYKHPNASAVDSDFEDAVDVALAALVKKAKAANSSTK